MEFRLKMMRKIVLEITENNIIFEGIKFETIEEIVNFDNTMKNIIVTEASRGIGFELAKQHLEFRKSSVDSLSKCEIN